MFSIRSERSRERGLWRMVVSMPFIYGMIVPIVMIDLAVSVYQQTCFRLYGITLVPRKNYVRWLPRGKGLPRWDRFNCAYCSYANGVGAYFRAVLIETEKYWCPIKYAARQGYHVPHPQEPYAKDGDAQDLKRVLAETAD